jgi:hypothetical protein
MWLVSKPTNRARNLNSTEATTGLPTMGSRTCNHLTLQKIRLSKAQQRSLSERFLVLLLAF